MNTFLHEQAQANSAIDRLLPFADVRKLVGLSRSKIYELLAEHAFPRPVKLGRNNYFSEREIQAWITARLDARSGR